MSQSMKPPTAGTSLAYMLEERRRLRRQQVLLESALRELKGGLMESLREKQRQEACSGWCGPDLARRVENFRSDVSRIWSALVQVRQAIQVASEEIDALLHNRYQPGLLGKVQREAS